MITELADYDFENLYAKLIECFPDQPWVKIVGDLQHEINETPTFKQLLWKQNIIAYGLKAFGEFGMASLGCEGAEAVMAGMIFASQVVHLLERISPNNVHKVCGRVRGALKKTDAMRGFLCELMTATHLTREGCTLDWVDEDQGDETFDLLASVPGVGVVEVECKSIALDRGESLKEKTFYSLIHHLIPLIEPVLPKLTPRPYYCISITLHAAVPDSKFGRMQLAERLAATVADEGDGISGLCSITLDLCSLPELSGDIDTGQLQGVANEIMGSGDGYRVIKSLGDDSCLAIDVQSSVPSKFEAALAEVTKKAVRKQMTGQRPGCLIVRLEGHSGQSLGRVSSEAANALARRAEKLLSDSSHSHLSTVVFLSAAAWEKVSARSQSQQSTAYIFESSTGRYPNLGLGKLFGLRS